MKHDWILDVLTDLRTFAHANGMNTLVEQLDDTRLLATAEIASKSAAVVGGRASYDGASEFSAGGSGTRERA